MIQIDKETKDKIFENVSELIGYAKDSASPDRAYIKHLLRSIFCYLDEDYNRKYGEDIFNYIEDCRERFKKEMQDLN